MVSQEVSLGCLAHLLAGKVLGCLGRRRAEHLPAWDRPRAPLECRLGQALRAVPEQVRQAGQALARQAELVLVPLAVQALARQAAQVLGRRAVEGLAHRVEQERPALTLARGPTHPPSPHLQVEALPFRPPRFCRRVDCRLHPRLHCQSRFRRPSRSQVSGLD